MLKTRLPLRPVRSRTGTGQLGVSQGSLQLGVMSGLSGISSFDVSETDAETGELGQWETCVNREVASLPGPPISWDEGGGN